MVQTKLQPIRTRSKNCFPQTRPTAAFLRSSAAGRGGRVRLFPCMQALILGALSVYVLLCAKPLAAQASKRPVVEIITFERLQALMKPNADTVRIINFWATSCLPCIEEMPAFDRLHREYATAKAGAKPLQVVFVSLDFKRDIAKKVIPFVQKRNLAAPVVFFGPPKSAEIDAVDSSWSGSMPATVIIGAKFGQRAFYEKKMAYDELKDFVKTYLFP